MKVLGCQYGYGSALVGGQSCMGWIPTSPRLGYACLVQQAGIWRLAGPELLGTTTCGQLAAESLIQYWYHAGYFLQLSRVRFSGKVLVAGLPFFRYGSLLVWAGGLRPTGPRLVRWPVLRSRDGCWEAVDHTGVIQSGRDPIMALLSWGWQVTSLAAEESER